MAIWFKEYNVAQFNKRGENTLAHFLEIKFSEIGEDYLIATMPVNEKTKQPIGILHGGANVVLAETVASTAANAVIDIEKFYCVGLEINANHIRSVKDGVVSAKAYPLHLGKSTQVWEIAITSKDKLTCISRMTASVITRY